MPSAVWAITRSVGRRTRGSRRNTHVSPSHGSRMTSRRQAPRDGVAHPGLIVRRERLGLHGVGEPAPDDPELELGERLANGRELLLRHGDLDVLVLPRLSAVVQVERPAGRDVPGRVDSREPARDLGRMPRVPERQIGLEGAPGHLGGQIQRRQRKSATWTIVETTMSIVETPSVQYASPNASSKFWP